MVNVKYLYNGRNLIKLLSKIFGFGIQNLPKISLFLINSDSSHNTHASSRMRDQLQLRVTLSNRYCWTWYRLCSYNCSTTSYSTCFVLIWMLVWGVSFRNLFLFKFLHSTHLTPLVDLSGEISIISTSVHYFTRNNTVDRYEHPSGFRCLISLKWLDRPCLQFSSVAQSCPTLCDPMNPCTPALPVYHQLLEFTQTHVHWVGDAIQPSHPLSSPFPPAPNPSQPQGLFQWVNSSHEVAKVLEFQLQHQSFQEHPGLISFRMDWLDLIAVQGIKNLLQHHS